MRVGLGWCGEKGVAVMETFEKELLVGNEDAALGS